MVLRIVHRCIPLLAALCVLALAPCTSASAEPLAETLIRNAENAITTVNTVADDAIYKAEGLGRMDPQPVATGFIVVDTNNYTAWATSAGWLRNEWFDLTVIVRVDGIVRNRFERAYRGGDFAKSENLNGNCGDIGTWHTVEVIVTAVEIAGPHRAEDYKSMPCN